MSKVDLCREILAARTLHAENDSNKDNVEKQANSCTNYNPRKIFGECFFVQHYQVHSWEKGCRTLSKCLVFLRVPTAEVLAVGFDPRMSSCPGSRLSLRKLSSSTWPEGRHETQVKLARKIGCHKSLETCCILNMWLTILSC